MIVYGIYSEQYIGMFRSENVPLVAVDYWTQDPVTDCVTVDVESEACQIVDLLMQQGHTSLGFVGLGRLAWDNRFYEYDPDIHRMLDSLHRTTRRRGLVFRDEWVLLVPNPRQLDEALRGYFSTQPRPTAVLCFDMNVTPAVLQTLADLSLRCPEDISIINRGSEQAAGRPMTSMVADPQEMGRIAVKLLAERMHGVRNYPVKLALPSRLVVGGSTGPAPRRIAGPGYPAAVRIRLLPPGWTCGRLGGSHGKSFGVADMAPAPLACGRGNSPSGLPRFGPCGGTMTDCGRRTPLCTSVCWN